MKDPEITSDPYFKIENINDMSIEEMKMRIREMEDTITRQYIEMTQCYVCKKCSICGNES